MDMRLSSASELETVRQQIAPIKNLGLKGSLWVGNDEDAKNIFVLNCLTYEDELIALAPADFLRRNPQIIKNGWRVGIVLARPERRTVTDNMNRIGKAMALWEKNRLEDIYLDLAVYGTGPYVAHTMDLQANSQPEGFGWTLDMKGADLDLERYSSKLACGIRISGLPAAQKNATRTEPIGLCLPGTVTEVLLQSEENPDAIHTATLTVLSALAGLGALDEKLVQHEDKQAVYTVVGSIEREAQLGYVIDQSLLKPFSYVSRGTLIAKSSQGHSIFWPSNCHLALGPTKPEVRPGSTDPLFYVLRREEDIRRIVRLPEWALQLS